MAWNMLEAKNTDYYNVKGIQINDPSIGHGDVLTEGMLEPGTVALIHTNFSSTCYMAAQRIRPDLWTKRDYDEPPQ